MFGLRVDLDVCRTPASVSACSSRTCCSGGKLASISAAPSRHARAHLRGQSMRAVWLVGRERSAVERCGHEHSFGKRARSAESVAATHAVAKAPTASRRTDGCLSSRAITRRVSSHHHRVVDRGDHALEPLPLRTLGCHDIRRERRERRAVVEVRKRNYISLRRQPLGHRRPTRAGCRTRPCTVTIAGQGRFPLSGVNTCNPARRRRSDRSIRSPLISHLPAWGAARHSI